MVDRGALALPIDDAADALLALYRRPPLDTLRAPAFGTPGASTLAVADLFERTVLDGLLERTAAAFGEGADRRAAASIWSKYHLSAVSIPALVANLLLERELPVASSAVRVSLGERGETARLWLPHGGRPLASRAPEVRFARLFDAHCRPLIEVLADLSDLSPKVFWSNLGHYVEYAGQACDRHPDFSGSGEPLLRFLETRTLPDGRRNPLYRPVRYLDLEGGASARVRRLCCIQYRLPGQPLCGGCPLKPEHRPPRCRG
ncbi:MULTISPECIES: siderophore-iron reductase FhuF [unclassified Modicisalibacter]|uniref:siderophore-iron reductase FhuF n=1 Tax=unclassified Modicisalibacter TaxID=2679913 RepID=UPI001CCCE6D4|nr:siderophore-iron reductase FhuF [Modicisalibacter sp. R2A 31.J]MBZ9573107.1 siderophore-iron reductase FhuF [Modicisalibacter sp. MOD 31.J]